MKQLKRINDYGKVVRRLFEESKEAMRHAYAPNSGVKFGGAGFIEGHPSIRPRVVTGFNSESAQYNDAIHCEESLKDAALRWYSPGKRPVRFFRDCMVLTTNAKFPISPCGSCRDVLRQHGDPDTKVIYANEDGDASDASIAQLLPSPRELIQDGLASPMEETELGEFLIKWVETARDYIPRQQTLAKDKVRYAVFFSFGHTEFRAGTVSQPAFHGFQAMELAAARAMDASMIEEGVFPIETALLVSDQKGYVLPFGRERQWIMDIAEKGEQSIRLYCVSKDKVLATESFNLLPFSCSGDLEKKIRECKI